MIRGLSALWLALLLTSAPAGLLAQTQANIPAHQLTLTPQEQAWLTDSGVLRMGIDTDWSPIETLDDGNRHRGIAADFLEIVLERAGLAVRLEHQTWPAVHERARLGQLDLLSAVRTTENREAYLDFTHPYLVLPYVIITSLDSNVDGVDDLRGRRVAVNDSYAVSELLAKRYPEVIRVSYKSTEDALKAVAFGWVDGYVTDIATGSDGLTKLGISNLHMAAQMPFDLELRVGVRKGQSELLSILNKAIETVPTTELDAIMARWIKIRFQTGVEIKRIVQIALPVSLILLIIFTIVMVANRRLKAKEGRLVELTQSLAEKNTFIQHTFGRYLSDEIVANILEEPEGLELGGRKQTLTIMMADLRGFTSLSEERTAEEVVTLINNYLKVMTQVIFRHNGIIDEFIGDAILAVFGAPNKRDDDELRAVACAVDMQLAMAEVNETNRAMGLPALHMGIGLHTAEVVIGNIGSERRAKYGVVGRGVNLASRIQSYTVGGQVLISESTFARITDDVMFTRSMNVQPKGVRQPITLYEVSGVAGAYKTTLAIDAPSLVVLPQALPVVFAVTHDDDTTEETWGGQITRLSSQRFELQTAKPLREFTNLRLSIVDARLNLLAEMFYGKVTAAHRHEDNVYSVHFTSLPSRVDAAVSGLLLGTSLEASASLSGARRSISSRDLVSPPRLEGPVTPARNIY